MALFKVTALLALAERNTLKLLTEIHERTYYIRSSYVNEANSEDFLYRVKSVFLNECDKEKIVGVVTKNHGDYFVDASVLEITTIPSEQLLDFYNKNPDIVIYNNE